ncbi:MAG TPA: T9SS type A sorting domain-containing protein, partial [Rubricoccaceae bacterium]|nr:T9SS type A sorting domain-containing protein [Rubricoccaceae bacterium]
PSCAISPSGLGLNNEAVSGQDVVFWYRSGALHNAGNPWECDIVGPMLNTFNPVTNEPPAPEMPGGVSLEAAYPNPFNPSTSVRFRVDALQHVTLTLHDALGRTVQTLFEGMVAAGRDEHVRIDGTNLPSGAYTVRLVGERAQATTRVVLLK